MRNNNFYERNQQLNNMSLNEILELSDQGYEFELHNGSIEDCFYPGDSVIPDVDMLGPKGIMNCLYEMSMEDQILYFNTRTTFEMDEDFPDYCA